jgi:hypothetical protein
MASAFAQVAIAQEATMPSGRDCSRSNHAIRSRLLKKQPCHPDGASICTAVPVLACKPQITVIIPCTATFKNVSISVWAAPGDPFLALSTVGLRFIKADNYSTITSQKEWVIISKHTVAATRTDQTTLVETQKTKHKFGCTISDLHNTNIQGVLHATPLHVMRQRIVWNHHVHESPM